MEISLYTSEILGTIRSVSHYEAANAVPDVEARYRVEAGTEKMDEIVRDIWKGHARARQRCARFLEDSLSQTSDNLLDLPDVFVFDLAMSERRSIGKAAPLGEALSTYITEHALAAFYASMDQGGLADKHARLAQEAGTRIDELLYSKAAPRV